MCAVTRIVALGTITIGAVDGGQRTPAFALRCIQIRATGSRGPALMITCLAFWNQTPFAPTYTHVVLLLSTLRKPQAVTRGTPNLSDQLPERQSLRSRPPTWHCTSRLTCHTVGMLIFDLDCIYLVISLSRTHHSCIARSILKPKIIILASSHSQTPLLVMADAFQLSKPIWYICIIILWWIQLAGTGETHVKLLREKYLCPHFRILVIGRANAGKTTIIEKVCGVANGTKLIIYDKDGELVWALSSFDYYWISCR